MFNTIISVLDTVPQYQESIESILLYNFSIFLSSIFTNIKSIFSYLFMFFNKSRDNDNQSEDDENKNKIIQDLQKKNTMLGTQVAQLLAANNGISNALTSHIESLTLIKQEFNESEQRNKELIALATFKSYLKMNKSLVCAVAYSARNNKASTSLVLDIISFNITQLMSKLEKVENMSVKYEIENKSKLVNEYQYEIRLQKYYLSTKGSTYFLDALKNEHNETVVSFRTEFTLLYNRYKTFLKKFKQMQLADEAITQRMHTVSSNNMSKLEDLKPVIMERVHRLIHLGSCVNSLDEMIKQLDVDLSNKPSTIAKYVENMVPLERNLLKEKARAFKYDIMLNSPDPIMDLSSVKSKLERISNEISAHDKQSKELLGQIKLIVNDLVASFGKINDLLRSCEDMCLREKKNID
jgi:hypothetical protein